MKVVTVVPMKSERWYVDPIGRVTKTPV